MEPMHGFVSVIPRLRWQDFLDILIVAYVIYRIALLIRGTRTMQMVIGLGVVAAAFMGSQMLGLFTLNWLLNNFLGSLIVILVVIFQADIRRALTGVGARPLFGARPSVAGVAQELATTAAWLSARRIGALIVIEQDVGLQDFVQTGRAIDGTVSPGVARDHLHARFAAARRCSHNQRRPGACGRLPVAAFEQRQRQP